MHAQLSDFAARPNSNATGTEEGLWRRCARHDVLAPPALAAALAGEIGPLDDLETTVRQGSDAESSSQRTPQNATECSTRISRSDKRRCLKR